MELGTLDNLSLERRECIESLFGRGLSGRALSGRALSGRACALSGRASGRCRVALDFFSPEELRIIMDTTYIVQAHTHVCKYAHNTWHAK